MPRFSFGNGRIGPTENNRKIEKKKDNTMDINQLSFDKFQHKKGHSTITVRSQVSEVPINDNTACNKDEIILSPPTRNLFTVKPHCSNGKHNQNVITPYTSQDVDSSTPSQHEAKNFIQNKGVAPDSSLQLTSLTRLMTSVHRQRRWRRKQDADKNSSTALTDSSSNCGGLFSSHQNPNHKPNTNSSKYNFKEQVGTTLDRNRDHCNLTAEFDQEGNSMLYSTSNTEDIISSSKNTMSKINSSNSSQIALNHTNRDCLKIVPDQGNSVCDNSSMISDILCVTEHTVENDKTIIETNYKHVDEQISSKYLVNHEEDLDKRKSIHKLNTKHDENENIPKEKEVKTNATHVDQSNYIRTQNDPNSKAVCDSSITVYSDISFCRACKYNRTIHSDNLKRKDRPISHHSLCPQHEEFESSGKKVELDLIIKGVQHGCSACKYNFEHGKPMANQVHDTKCPRIEKEYRRKKAETNKNSKREEKETESRSKIPKSQPKLEKTDIESEEQDKPRIVRVENNKFSMPFPSSWVPCENPWGSFDHENICDMIITSPLIKQDFTEDYCREKYSTNDSITDGEYRLIKITRDRLSLRVWGLNIRALEKNQSGPCIIESIDFLSPAHAAVRIRLDFFKLSTLFLKN